MLFSFCLQLLYHVSDTYVKPIMMNEHGITMPNANFFIYDDIILLSWVFFLFKVLFNKCESL